MFKRSMQQFPYFLSRTVGNFLKKTCTEVLRFASSLQITLTKFVLSLGWYVLKIFHINFPKWYFILKCKLDHLLTFSLLWSFHYRTIFFFPLNTAICLELFILRRLVDSVLAAQGYCIGLTTLADNWKPTGS